MPVIKPYQQQIAANGSLGGRQASGADFGGAGLHNLGQGVVSAGIDLARTSAILQHGLAQKEATNAAIYVSELQTSAANDLDADALAWKPGMDSVPGVTMGKVKAMLDKGAEQFTTALGQDTYRKHAASMTAHFAEISGNIQAKLDGQAAVLQMENHVNTQGVHLQTHPASAPGILDEMAQILGSRQGIYANIGALAQQKLVHEAQEKLAVSGVQGLIRMMPLLAEQILTDPNLATNEKYGWIAKHVPQEKLATLIDHARVMGALEVHKKELANAALAKATDMQQKETLGLGTVNWIKDQASPQYNPAQTKRDTIQFLQQYPDAVANHPEMVRALLGAIDSDIAEQKAGKAHGNLDLENTLATGIINKTITDTTPILQGRAQLVDPLSTEQMTRLTHMFRDRTSPGGQSLNEQRQSAFKMMEQIVAPRDKFGAFVDTSMAYQVELAKQFADVREAQFLKEKKDVFSLYNPTSPDYVFSPEILARFSRSMADRMANAVDRLGFGAKPSPLSTTPPVTAAPGTTPKPTAYDFMFGGKKP